jgi:deoxyribodipyrimidine photolyase-related protein
MQRKRLEILVDSRQKPEGSKWSFDSKNRKKFPKEIEIPALPKFNNEQLERAKKYIKENFADNPGDLENFFYPVSRKEAKELLADFIENKFNNFGKYQDAFEKEIVVGFHSLISSSLNIGLLNPAEVVETVLEHYQKSELELASVEGFIRQIIGWREYVRALYDLESETMKNSDFFKHQRDLPEIFYQAESGIEVLDDSIKKAVDYAYTHHIERLMVLGNFFLLSELDQHQVFKWFMEMFIDAYEWVMFANVYGMSQYSYPEMMTKPYISSSNYIQKMSHYKTGKWAEVWDGLYWSFLDKNKDKFADNPRMSLMLSILDRMDREKLKKHRHTAADYLATLN